MNVSGLPHLPYCTVRGPLAIHYILKEICGSSVVNQSKDLEI